MTTDQPLLDVRGLRTSFFTPAGEVRAVDGVDLQLHRGEALGSVGESGSGKSTVALALMGLLPAAGRVVEGEAKICERRHPNNCGNCAGTGLG